jgi:hypothetical protein
VISSIDKENLLSKGGISIRDILADSKLSPQAKEYFIKALDSCSDKSYGKNKNSVEVGYEAKFFKELIKIL